MLRFRFKVSNAAGKVRSGHITASSLTAAQRAVESNGYSILELVESAESDSRPSPSAQVRRGSPTVAYQPHLVDHLEAIEAAPAKRKGVLAFLTLLGLLLCLLSGFGPSMTGAPVASTPKPQEIRLVITGLATVPPKQRARATLHFQMPEVPLGLIRDYNGLVEESGSYRVEYDFESSKAPSYFIAELQVDGRRVDQGDRALFSGQPLSGQAPPLVAPLANP